MLRTNQDRLVEVAVCGEAWPPALQPGTYRTDMHGRAQTVPGTAGIIYNARVGQSAYTWAGDHVEPCVSMRNREIGAEQALHYLTCMGNEAIVTSGRAIGHRGVATGEHAHIMVDFPDETLKLLCIGDQIQIRAYGMGLELLDYPSIHVRKLSPALLARMNIRELGDGRIEVPVSAIVPPFLMGSGAELGADYVDQDILTNDQAAVKQYGLDKIRVGDFIAVLDHDHTYNRGYKKNAIVIGFCNHADSSYLGHGPGCMDIFACLEPIIVPKLDPNANIANYLGIGAYRA